MIPCISVRGWLGAEVSTSVDAKAKSRQSLAWALLIRVLRVAYGCRLGEQCLVV
jgi:hypothetical protein